MAKFEFSLQKVLDLRDFEKRQAEIELGKANADVMRIQNELDIIASQKINVRNAVDSSDDLTMYTQSQNYFRFLDQKKEKALEEMTRAQMVYEEKREIFSEAMKNLKALEKLKEKKKEQWVHDMNLIEESENEEIVSSRILLDEVDEE